MAGGDFQLALAKIFFQQIGAFETDVQKIRLAGGLVVRHARFIKMAQIVKFVTEDGIVQPSLLIDPFIDSSNK